MKIYCKDIWKYAVINNWNSNYILWRITGVWGYKTILDDWIVTLVRDICGDIDTFEVHESQVLFKFFDKGIIIEQ